MTLAPAQFLVRAENNTQGIDSIIDAIAQVLKDLGAIAGTVMAAPFLTASGALGGPGFQGVVNSIRDDAKDIAHSILSMLQAARGAHRSVPRTFLVPVNELDAHCTTGYSVEASVSVQFSSGDSDGGESCEVSTSLQWGNGAPQVRTTVYSQKNASIPDVVHNNLVGQSGSPGNDTISLGVHITADAESDFTDPKKPTWSQITVTQVVFKFTDACPGH